MSVMKPETVEAYNQYKELSSSRVLSEVGKLLPCPFCGNTSIKTQSGTNVDLMTQYNGRYVYCEECGVFMRVKKYSEWNRRANFA